MLQWRQGAASLTAVSSVRLALTGGSDTITNAHMVTQSPRVTHHVSDDNNKKGCILPPPHKACLFFFLLLFKHLTVN